jgi:hypothetical protein
VLERSSHVALEQCSGCCFNCSVSEDIETHALVARPLSRSQCSRALVTSSSKAYPEACDHGAIQVQCPPAKKIAGTGLPSEVTMRLGLPARLISVSMGVIIHHSRRADHIFVGLATIPRTTKSP